MKSKQTRCKETPDFSMPIPSQTLEDAGIAGVRCAELHQLKHSVIVLQGKMTAHELIEAILDLNGLTESLTVQLSKACGPCDSCGACAEGSSDSNELQIPPELLDELGIPRDAKLAAYADHDTRLIHVGPANYEHDLSDIPKGFLDMLSAAGVCLGVLEELLITEDTVYGG